MIPLHIIQGRLTLIIYSLYPYNGIKLNYYTSEAFRRNLFLINSDCYGVEYNPKCKGFL